MTITYLALDAIHSWMLVALSATAYAAWSLLLRRVLDTGDTLPSDVSTDA